MTSIQAVLEAARTHRNPYAALLWNTGRMWVPSSAELGVIRFQAPAIGRGGGLAGAAAADAVAPVHQLNEFGGGYSTQMPRSAFLASS